MERPISGIYTKSAIQKEHSKYTQKPTLEHTTINENIAVRSHVRYIDRYREETAWYALTYEDTLPISEGDSPLNSPYSDEASAILPV
ncbi:MAG TPA: hypothetical protein O0X23_05175 [Methanocorpusculum sp.]|nr:hypothetical protein [Methanocorpusculum sp.]